jgi:3-hydroxyacyl-[acyl-carrier-protein] dehydratase
MIKYQMNVDIGRWLSQKKPFLFIDEVVEIKYPILEKKRKDITPSDLIGSEVICKFFTDENLDFFRGHFPGDPVVPGVILLEMMGQTCAFTLCRKWSYEDIKSFGSALVGIDNARFKKAVRPNETLTIHTKYVKNRRPLGVFDCKILNESGALVASATLKNMIFEGDRQ